MSSRILKPGFRVGKYEVLAHIATGGMGTVYKASDVELGRVVALKVLSSRQVARGPTALERFRREARHVARLSHKHIVTLFECGYDADHDLHYLALEYVDGIDLGEHIERKGKLPPEEARHILIQAVKALDHAFERGIIHRDVKPSNFLLAQVGNKVVVKMTDLGLARAADDEAFKVTSEGNTVGTIDYMAPEQARDSRATDVRSDIYSLGCTAYHMLAGHPPFCEGGLGERLYRHMEASAPDVRQFNPAVSPGFWAILSKMLAKKPEDRYATPAALLRDLHDTPGEVSTGPLRLKPATRRKTDLALVVPSSTKDAPPRHVPPTPQPETSSSSTSPTSLVTPDQARAAAAFHERALQVLAEGRGDDYAHELLLNCLKLDPFNHVYHKTLRELNHKTSRGVLGRLFSPLNVLASKSKMHLARSNGDWRRVLEYGEDVLAHQPADAETHLGMAEAAEQLGFSNLAVWFLEQGRQEAPQSSDLVRAMARLCEESKDWRQAIALWEKVRQLEPNDREAYRKVHDLSVEEHLAKGTYGR